MKHGKMAVFSLLRHFRKTETRQGAFAKEFSPRYQDLYIKQKQFKTSSQERERQMASSGVIGPYCAAVDCSNYSTQICLIFVLSFPARTTGE